jgi:hypothetical protein
VVSVDTGTDFAEVEVDQIVPITGKNGNNNNSSSSVLASPSGNNTAIEQKN